MSESSSSDVGTFKMHILRGEFTAKIKCGPNIEDRLRNTDFVIAPKDLNTITHNSKENPHVDITVVRQDELIQMLRQVEDHRGVRVYEKADISFGHMSHNTIMNYQTFVSQEKIVGIYELNDFFATHGYAGSVSSVDALLMRSNVDGIKYAALYVPPIIEYKDKNKVQSPLARLLKRIDSGGEVLQLPGFNNNGSLKLDKIIAEWKRLLDCSMRSVPVLKDGTHRCYSTTLAGSPVRAIIINETQSLMQSVPVRTGTLVITTGKPKERPDRFLGMKRIGVDRWIGWVDLGRMGIDG